MRRGSFFLLAGWGRDDRLEQMGCLREFAALRQKLRRIAAVQRLRLSCYAERFFFSSSWVAGGMIARDCRLEMIGCLGELAALRLKRRRIAAVQRLRLSCYAESFFSSSWRELHEFESSEILGVDEADG